MSPFGALARPHNGTRRISPSPPKWHLSLLILVLLVGPSLSSLRVEDASSVTSLDQKLIDEQSGKLVSQARGFYNSEDGLAWLLPVEDRGSAGSGSGDDGSTDPTARRVGAALMAMGAIFAVGIPIAFFCAARRRTKRKTDDLQKVRNDHGNEGRRSNEV